MILYTVYPVEEVLQELWEKSRDFREISVEGLRVVVEPISMTEAKIVRIISTDPQDYLNPLFAPGNILRFPPFSPSATGGG